MTNFIPDKETSRTKILDGYFMDIGGLIHKASEKGIHDVEWRLPYPNNPEVTSSIIETLKVKGYNAFQSKTCSGSCDYGCSCRGVDCITIVLV